MRNFIQLFLSLRIKNLFFLSLIQFLILTYLNTWANYFWPSIFFITSTFFSAAAGNLINDIFDYKIDQINRPGTNKTGIFSFKTNIFFYLLFTFICLIPWPFVKANFFFPVLGVQVFLFYYSYQLKKYPLAGNLVVAILSSIAILQTIPIALDRTQEQFVFIWFLGFFSFLSTLIREIIKDIEDIEGDRLQNCKTLPISVGIPKTKKILNYLILLLIISEIYWGLSLIHFYSMVWMLLVVLVFSIFTWLKLFKAKIKSDYTQLSKMMKILMLLGILIVIFVHFKL